MDSQGRIEVIRELCSFEGRVAGTDAERRAANALASRLRAAGRQVEVEPTYVHPQVWLVVAAHAALGFAGSLVSVAAPAIGFALVLLAAASLYLDFNTRLYLLRALFFRRASQNVFSPGPLRDRPARVVLTAHLDVARTGYLFNERSRRRQARLPASLRLAASPPRVLFWSLAALLPMLGARMAGIDESWLALVQLVPTLVLLVATFLLVDIQLSDPVPGASDGASGVAVALSAAETLAARPPRTLDVCVLLTGAEESLMEGMRAFVRAHGSELDRQSTYFIVLEAVGSGELHYLTGEGLAVTYAHSPRLAQLCAAISTAAEEAGRPGAAPITLAAGSDALPATLAGYPAITIRGLREDGLPPFEHHTPRDVAERIDLRALERAQGFVVELVRQLDRDVARAR